MIFMKPSCLHPLLFLLAVTVLAVGCASMSTTGEPEIRGKITPPTVIYVKPFHPGSHWQGDFGNLSKDAFIKQEMEKLNLRMLYRTKEIAPDTRMAPSSLPNSGLLITGNIHHVNAGSGASRYFVGNFGGGAREVVTDIMIYDLAKSSGQPVAKFRLEGGSRGEGGIIGAVTNLDAEWDRIARETCHFIQKQLIQ